MGVDLDIVYADGTEVSRRLGPLEPFQNGWTPIAEGLGLGLAARFPGYYVIDPAELDELLAQLHTLREAVLTRTDRWRHWAGTIDEVVGLLTPLKTSTGWSACVG